jgi:PKD repeat protein
LSHDPDGTVASYRWDFGDGTTATATTPTTTHEYADPGTYAVTLTVRDGSGATDDTTQQVAAEDEAPPPAGPAWRATAAVDVNASRPVVTVPAAVQAGDRLVLVVSTNRAATLATPAGWTLLGTVSDGTDVRSWLLTRLATAGLAGTNLQLTLDATSKTSVTLSAYSAAAAPSAFTSRAEPASTSTHTAPAAAVTVDPAVVLRYYVDKGALAHGWTLSSTLVQRASTTGTGSGFLTAVLGEQGGVAVGTAPALSATSGITSAKAIMWTVVLPPA